MNNFKERAITVIPIFLIILFFIGMTGTDFDGIPGDKGDARFNLYILENNYQWLTGKCTSFWSPPIFFPAKNTKAYSDAHIGNLPIYALFRTAQFSPGSSFQLWYLTIFLLNYLAAFFVLRQFTFTHLSSATGSLVFTLSMPVLFQIGHCQLIPRFLIPFAFLYASRFSIKPEIRSFALLCGSIVGQLYVGIYMGLFTIIIISIWMVISFGQKTHLLKLLTFMRTYYGKILLIAGVSAVILAPYLLPYMQVSASTGGRTWEEVLPMIPKVHSWFFLDTPSLIYDTSFLRQKIQVHHEHSLFIGVLVYGIIGATCVLLCKNPSFYTDSHRKLLQTTVGVMLITVILFTKVKDVTLYKYLIFPLPGFGAIRAVTRIILALLFLYSIVIAGFMSNLEKFCKSKGTIKYAPMLLAILVCIDNSIPAISQWTYSKKDALTKDLALARRLAGSTTPFYLKRTSTEEGMHPPVNGGIEETHLNAMFASLYSGVPTMNGYSGLIPPGYHYVNWLQVSPVRHWMFDNNIKSVRIMTPESETLLTKPENIQLTSPTSPLTDFSHFISISPPDFSLSADTPSFTITVKNTGKHLWPGKFNGPLGIALSYSLNKADFSTRFFLPYDVNPGESVEIPVIVNNLKPGKNTIQFSIVQELVAWWHLKTNSNFHTEIVLKDKMVN